MYDKMNIIALLLLFIIFLHVKITIGKRQQNQNQNNNNNKKSKHILLKSVRQCDGQENLPIYIKPMRIVQEGKNKYYTYGEVMIRENFTNGFKASIDVKQCKDTVNLHLCSAFLHNFGSNQLCDILKTHSDAYSTYLNKIVPRPMCPLKQGSLIINRIPVNDNFLKYMPVIHVSHWLTNITGYVNKRMVACFHILLTVTPSRF